MINDRLILVWYEHVDGRINIWDTEKGELFLAVGGTKFQELEDLKISGDRSKFYSLDKFSIQAWSIQTRVFMGQ